MFKIFAKYLYLPMVNCKIMRISSDVDICWCDYPLMWVSLLWISAAVDIRCRGYPLLWIPLLWISADLVILCCGYSLMWIFAAVDIRCCKYLLLWTSADVDVRIISSINYIHPCMLVCWPRMLRNSLEKLHRSIITSISLCSQLNKYWEFPKRKSPQTRNGGDSRQCGRKNNKELGLCSILVIVHLLTTFKSGNQLKLYNSGTVALYQFIYNKSCIIRVIINIHVMKWTTTRRLIVQRLLCFIVTCVSSYR